MYISPSGAFPGGKDVLSQLKAMHLEEVISKICNKNKNNNNNNNDDDSNNEERYLIVHSMNKHFFASVDHSPLFLHSQHHISFLG